MYHPHKLWFTQGLCALAIVTLSSCATTSLTKDQCATIKPETQGMIDGQKGQLTNVVDDTIQKCGATGALGDVSKFKNEYLKAYQKGLLEYCTPQNGERVGLKGETYYNVCPRETGAAFLKEYLYARKLYQDANPQAREVYVPYDRYDRWGYRGPWGRWGW